jgi:hypothetical protein
VLAVHPPTTVLWLAEFTARDSVQVPLGLIVAAMVGAIPIASKGYPRKRVLPLSVQ